MVVRSFRVRGPPTIGQRRQAARRGLPGSGSGEAVCSQTRRHGATSGPPGSGASGRRPRGAAPPTRSSRPRRAAAATASLIRGAKLRGGLVRPGHQRLAEPDRQLPTPRARPALAARHRRERAAVGDRDHRHPVLAGEVGRAQPEPPHPAVGGAGALGEDQQAPAVGEHVARGVRHRPAAPLDREGVEQQRRPDGPPPGVEEVVGRGGHRRPSSPLVRQRQQHQRGVEVGGVVGGEDDRPARPGPARRAPRHESGPGNGRPAPARPSAPPRGRPGPARGAPTRCGTPRLGRPHPRLGRPRHLRAPTPAPAAGDLPDVVDAPAHDVHVVTSASRCGGLCR